MTVSGTRARLTGSPDLRPWVALVAVYVLWGSTFTGIQVAVRYIPPLLMSGTRYLLAGLLLYVVAGHEGSWRRFPGRWGMPSRGEALSAAVVGLFLLLGGNGLLSLGEVKVQSGLAALMIATVPLWMGPRGGVPTGLRGGGAFR